LNRQPNQRDWILSFAVLIGVTAALLAIRSSLDKTHVALGYLLVVLSVSALRGRGPGLVVSVLAFLCFNFFFLLPHYTLRVADPRDWAVLGAFLATSLVAAQLLARARNAATSAESRATEIERLSTLGAETLNAARAEEALVAIAEVIRSTLDASFCEVYVRNEESGKAVLAARSGESSDDASIRELGQPGTDALAQWAVADGNSKRTDDALMRASEDGESIGAAAVYSPDPRTLVVPLRARDRTVGVLVLASDQSLILDPPKRRFLGALSYYAALGTERLRLSREAERAAALQKADEFKDQLLASVSHDLRTPLTTIKALAHEIRRDGDDRAVIIEEEADRLNRFVADLLDLSRIAGGALHVKPEINAAEDLVGAVLQRVSGAVGDRRLVAALDPSEPLLLGRFDFPHSLRILSNLLENAIRFSPSQSTVELNARRINQTLEFEVADRGSGVPEPDRDRIFAPFYKPDTGTRDTTGAGLGLAIARGLAEAQGGTLRYEPRDGGGSLFSFTVPAADVVDLDGSTEAVTL
jgi:two-component system, OmpR family, sensor histidine kinase KdpD